MDQCAKCGRVLEVLSGKCPVCDQGEGDVDELYASTEAVIETLADPVDRQAAGEPGFGIDLTVGDVIGGAFRMWGQTFGRQLLMGLAGQVALVPLLLWQPDFTEGFSGISWMMIGVIILITLLIGIPVAVWAAICSIIIAADQARHGKQVRSMAEVALKALGSFWSYLGAALLVGLALILCGVPAVILISLVAPASAGAAVIGVLLFFALIIYLAVRWLVVGEAVVLENKPAFEAIRRSGELVSGNWWLTFGILLIFWLIMIGVVIGIVLLSLIPFVGQVINLASGVLTTPLSICFVVAIYAGLFARFQRLNASL